MNKQTSQQTNATTNLDSILLNDPVPLAARRSLGQAPMPGWDKLAATEGGVFQCPLGMCKLKICRQDGSALLALKCDQQAVALAALVWEDFVAESVWQSLVAQHTRMLRAKKLSVAELEKARPENLPWIGISLAPTFFKSASRDNIQRVQFVLWDGACGVLDHERKTAAKN